MLLWRNENRLNGRQKTYCNRVPFNGRQILAVRRQLKGSSFNGRQMFLLHKNCQTGFRSDDENVAKRTANTINPKVSPEISPEFLAVWTLGQQPRGFPECFLNKKESIFLRRKRSQTDGKCLELRLNFAWVFRKKKFSRKKKSQCWNGIISTDELT